MLKTYSLDKMITLPNFLEFKEPRQNEFLVFRFHNYFDGLLGINNLMPMGAVVDLENKILTTHNTTNILHFKPNLTSKKFLIEGYSQTVVKIPVSVENGEIFIHPVYVKRNLYIPEGIFKAENYYAYVVVINESKEKETLYLEQPIRVERYVNEKFIEFNNFNVQHRESKPKEKFNIYNALRISHLNDEEKQSIIKICKEFEDVFFKEGTDLTFTNKIKHSIRLTDESPIYSKSYRYPYIHKEEVRSQIHKMLEQNIIRPSYSPWSSPIWIVPKKIDASGKQKWRLVIDYRKLNEKTVDDKYPIPNITEILDKLGKCTYFSTLDLASGFHQIEMDPDDVEKTAFSVEGGHYEFIRMPFGLKNAPSTFQRVMDNVLRDLQGKVCLVYLDDIIIFSTSLQEHIHNLKLVFQKLRDANFKVQLDKSEFLHKEVAFLGHIITSEGVKPNPDKIKAIKSYPIPQTKTEIKSFLGLLGYYRKFIKDFAKLTKPFTECLKKDKSVILTEKYKQTFEICKDLLTNDPILQYPDFNKPFILTTDASNFAIGAVLSQGTIGSDKPICYASRTLSQTEINYSTIEKELLAIVWATKYFRPYLYGRQFKLVTDHKPLIWLMNLKDPNTKLNRWRLRLEEFNYEIIYKKGTQNTNADALSRIKINENQNPIKLVECNNQNSSVENDDSSNLATIHSGQENLNDHIYISERPLNDFNTQLVFENSDRESTRIENFFKNKQRRTFKMTIINEETLTELFKKFLVPKKMTAIFTNDDIFRTIQTVYTKYFSKNKSFKIVRCTEKLIDVEEEDVQESLIREYHKKHNHRGINETVAHLKREYYFP